MSKVTLTSDITVRLIDKSGGDHSVVAAAKVSTCGAEAMEFTDPAKTDANKGLIRWLMRNRHGTPFEHACLTFFVHAPAMVWWEWIRHRVGHAVNCPDLSSDASFNLESGRYRVLAPIFWVPRKTRKLKLAASHKPAHPSFVAADEGEYAVTISLLAAAYEAAWSSYQQLVSIGVANEAARSVLGFGVYYSGWVTCNPRSLMSFLSLRTHEPASRYISYPQAEIEEAARAAESVFACGWPITHSAFCEFGRVAP